MPSTIVEPRQTAVSRCWICGSADTTDWKARSIDRALVPEDFQITDSRYGITVALLKCCNCGFIFAAPDEFQELTSLYERLSDPEYEKGQHARSLQMRWLLKSATKVNSKAATLLDIGAGTGLLVAEAKRMHLDAVGVEPSRSLVKSAARLNGVEILNGTFPHSALAGRKFDLVFLVDVIEHVSNPVELLRHCKEALNTGGVLVVVTPDVSSVAARILGKRWWHLRLAHVGYFDRRSMREANKVAGLKTIETLPAKWFFPVHYLADRIAVYLPIKWLNRLAERVTPLRWLYKRVIPLTLRDSLVFLLTASGE